MNKLSAMIYLADKRNTTTIVKDTVHSDKICDWWYCWHYGEFSNWLLTGLVMAVIRPTGSRILKEGGGGGGGGGVHWRTAA